MHSGLEQSTKACIKHKTVEGIVLFNKLSSCSVGNNISSEADRLAYWPRILRVTRNRQTHLIHL